MAKRENDPLPIYESRPPEWLPKTHNSADLGYVGFFPVRPDQEEDVLDVKFVKEGFQQIPEVHAESYSAQEAVKQKLLSDDGLSSLESLMSQIFARRAENTPPIPPSSFKLPSRVTMNDAKRQAWFADLANPDVPLHKLGKSVPHGAKGHDLLDLLHQNNVAITRAVWFLRVFGGNETAGLRNKPHYIPTQYSVDWANVVVGYLKKQLTEIALPMAPRPGLNVKQSFKGVLSDQISRDRWVSRFTYSLNLLRAFYAEGLVDHRTLLVWLVQQMYTCNLAQLGFLTRLAEEYFDGMLISRALTRSFVEACLTRLSEVNRTSAKEQLPSLEAVLKSLVLRGLLGHRDAFVNPRLWYQYSTLLESILAEYISQHSGDGSSTESTPALNETFLAAYEDVKKRNEAMLFKNLPPRVLGSLSSALSDIKLLNSLSGTTSIESCPFFCDTLEPSPELARKVDILLTWSVTPLQYGDHRPYAAACLLKFWRDKAEERAARRDRESPAEEVQDYLFDWLDTSEVAGDESNLPDVALLFDQLVKHGLFDYGQYIQRLIARGEQGLSFTDTNPSRHRRFLQWIPIHDSSASLVSQRKVTLYGLRTRETPEDQNEREIRRQIRAVLPELFGGEPPINSGTVLDMPTQISGLLTATRFEQVRVLRSWLLPILKKAIAAQSKLPDSTHVLKAYLLAITLMARCRHYGIILELTLFALEHAMTNEFLSAILQTLRQHVEVWGCLNKMRTIAEALYATHNFWKTRGVQSRDLLNLLFSVDSGVRLEQSARDQLVIDQANFIRAFHPIGDQPVLVPAALPEILLLATDPNAEAPSILANSLWYKFRTAPDWAWKVWDNTVASIRQIPSMISDPAGRRACALRYSTFLIQVDRHLPTGLDEHVLAWLTGSGRNELAALSIDAWDLLVVVLVHLASHNSLAVTSILEGIVYPAWQAASKVQSLEQGVALESTLPIVNELCSRLLLSDGFSEGIPPLDVLEFQGLQTGRRDVYRGQYFATLVQNIPSLVLLEQNMNVPEQLRQGCSALREAICSSSVFRLGTYRELDVVHDAFQAVLANPEVSEEKHESLISALRFIFNEGHQGAAGSGTGLKALSTILSPWKLAATSIELRFTIRQLDEELHRPSSKDKADKSLSNLATQLFGQGMDSEQADFIADMVKGVSPGVVGKFINSGLRRIAEILKESIVNLSNLQDSVAKAGKVLRLLSNLAEPMRSTSSPTPLPQLDVNIQESLVPMVYQLLSGISDQLSPSAKLQGPSDVGKWTSAAIFLARVLQFDLGFPGAWTQWMKDHCEELSQTLGKLVLIFGSGMTLDVIAFSLLLDTLYYLLDEIPMDPKATVADPFRCYPTYELHSLSPDMPLEFRTRIRALLPYVSPSLTVADLAYATTFKDASGNTETSFVAVQNRPWEWTENLGEPSGLDMTRDSAETRGAHTAYHANDQSALVKNSASLSLDLFGTRVVGRRVHLSEDVTTTGTEQSRVDGALRMLEDDLLSESVFRRDFRETRVDPSVIEAKVTVAHDQEHSDQVASATAAASSSDRHPSSRVGSPSGSTRSRGSMQPPSLHSGSGSRRGSPATMHSSTTQHTHSALSKLAGSSAEPIDVDMLDADAMTDTTGGTKRKNTDEDDEVQVLEGPTVASQSHAKRTKTKARVKNR